MDRTRKEKRRTIEGSVVSDKMNNTVKVVVETPMRHPVYKKIVMRRSAFMVHNPGMEISVGDKVRIMESRPMSKNVRWVLVEKLA